MPTLASCARSAILLSMKSWMLYGAYGFTGRLLAAEAVRRGHRPVLAGRDAAKPVSYTHLTLPTSDLV